MSGFNMDDYITVPERVDAFITKHPEGSLQSEIVELSESRVTVKAYAYRTPDDPRPGIGHSSLEIPGKTPYTRGSEIENAETSAWGRAIAALGFDVKRGMASAEEVRNKRTNQKPDREEAAVPSGGAARRGSTTAAPGPAHPAVIEPDAAAARERMLAAAERAQVGMDVLSRMAIDVGIPAGQKGTAEQYDLMAAMLGNDSAERKGTPAEEEAADGDSPPVASAASTESTAGATSASVTDAAVTGAAGPSASAAPENPLEERINRANERAARQSGRKPSNPEPTQIEVTL